MEMGGATTAQIQALFVKFGFLRCKYVGQQKKGIPLHPAINLQKQEVVFISDGIRNTVQEKMHLENPFSKYNVLDLHCNSHI